MIYIWMVTHTRKASLINYLQFSGFFIWRPEFGMKIMFLIEGISVTVIKPYTVHLSKSYTNCMFQVLRFPFAFHSLCCYTYYSRYIYVCLRTKTVFISVTAPIIFVLSPFEHTGLWNVLFISSAWAGSAHQSEHAHRTLQAPNDHTHTHTIDIYKVYSMHMHKHTHTGRHL